VKCKPVISDRVDIDDDLDDVDLADRKRHSAGTGDNVSSGHKSTNNMSVGAKNPVGRTCLASVDGEKRFGEIVKIKRSGDTGITVVVQFFGTAWGGTAPPPITEFSSEAVQMMPAAKNLTVGSRCQAVASDDGRLHSCTIEKVIGKSGYKVRFLGLGMNEELRSDRVYAPQRGGESEAVGAGNKKKKFVKEIITPGGYKLPEYLQVKPTDSQHQIASKRRKISMLKKEQRKEQVEEHAKERQSSWLQHNHKVSSKHVNTTKSSIFSTSENPSGKVGVTNSGRGMTSFQARQRHEFENVDDE